MQTRFFMALPTLTSINFSVSRTLWLALFSKSTHAQGLLSKLHWLPIEHRIKFKLATITYKALTINQPSYILSRLHPYQPAYHTRSADQQLLAKPICNTVFGQRAFSYAAPQIWDEIPLETRASTSIESFKRKLKSHFWTSLNPPVTFPA